MALTRGRIQTASFDDGGGADLIGRIVDGEFTLESSEIDVTTHDSDDFREFLQGRKSGTVELSCRADEADVGQIATIAAHLAETAGTLVWETRGGVSGADRYTASAFCMNASISAPNDEEAKITFTFRLTGTITLSAIP